ncbi:MAG: 5-formyltetrahydrofolate cyclo-ligase [Coriobacteriaceae bacterium]|uniref:5-formyltetrahydrofolate cyclo-ligase n=1 Tax=Tractidigestivibacter sp. TaxID=2847320 RepID=UPI002A83FAF8|nr:5-formyltetrahydrofolate cyclo-ligase [Tractidigestivibacter sp.]MCI6274918.1 5-formyltetrahydrofolate cyclo-ligase [Coriobacteriaceae bacterium]MCI6547281.1 5-formyltetrahydrofolate cyclo-ligase [Coriobacteriaceae bacterium]MCI6844936.1 5-formyltetrahydrofolate cyclo-ligase [Coriobacteriaceae bacterium]MCI7438203.1 5-formyltetrahydrofolate cyclo-ligase [Coriobacteriaceae bacterium]MDD7583677.1 5-formyltetrahydrofolate cyclo-ligase [Coriobacteriaceae bacterium]
MASSQGSDAGKTALREEYARARARMAPHARAATDARILLELKELPVWQSARLVLTYVSFGSEVDTHALMQAAWVAGKSVAVPRCRASRALDFYAISSEDDLEPGMRGLMEPSRDFGRPLTPAQMVGSLCIVPGLVFDAEGHRIGYGGGYYDRFLAFYPGEKVALVRPWQLSGNPLPRDGHDIAVDWLVSTSGSWCCNPLVR